MDRLKGMGGRPNRWSDAWGELAWLRCPPASPAPVRFCWWNEGIVILVTTGSPRWSVEALRAGRVSLSISPGQWTRCAVRALSSIELRGLPQIMEAFRRRYGAELFQGHLATPDTALFLTPEEPGSSTGTWEAIRREFDAAATTYSENNRANPVDRYAKARSLERLEGLFLGRDPLLELGPGTGIETIPLLAGGHRISAVDISPGMLSALRARAEAEGRGDALETRLGPLGELPRLLSSVPDGYFKGAFSTFGALNLEPDLSRVPQALARVLAPESPLFLGVLNRLGLPPLVFSALQGRMGEIRARFMDPIPVEGIGYPLALHPFTRKELANRLAPWFSFLESEAVTVLSPTHYSPRLWGLTDRTGRATLARWDARLARLWPFRELGEWSFLTFRRTRAAVPAFG